MSRPSSTRRTSLGLALSTAAAVQGSPCNSGMTYSPQVMPGTKRMIAPDWRSCSAAGLATPGAAFFSFWPADGGCHLHGLDALVVEASGWGADQVISGRLGCVLTDTTDKPAAREVPKQSPRSPLSSTCPGQFHMEGYGDVSIVPTGWAGAPGSTKLGDVHLESGKVVPHMNGRAYFADVCTGVYNHSQYLGLNLVGKKLTLRADVSQADCGCNAAFYLTSMNKNPRKSQCGDYYCDANNVCGESCAEIDILEANKHAFHSTLHTSFDHGGKGVGYGGGDGWNGPRDFTKAEYGANGRCVDTDFPFDIEVAFPVDGKGVMKGMFVKLSQEGKDCPIHIAVDQYDGMAELQQALAGGMTPIVSYWEADDMLWMDGEGADHKGPCHVDTPKKCGDVVSFSNFRIEPLGDIIVSGAPASQSPAPAGWTPAPAAPAPPAWTPPPAPPAWTPPSTEATTTTRPPCSITRKVDCTLSQCCADPGMQCYVKHKYWAACQLDCTPGIDPRDPDGQRTPWTCEELGERSPGAPIITTTTTPAFGEEPKEPEAPAWAPAPASPAFAPQAPVPAPSDLTCADTQFENCQESQCCKDPGMQCFRKHKWWSACLWECPSSETDVWSCDVIGDRTPGDPVSTTTQPWAFPNQIVKESDTTVTITFTTTRPSCSRTRKENCAASQCCEDPGMQCYEKNEFWAACQLDCTPGPDIRDSLLTRTPWSCKEIGERSFGFPIVTTTTPGRPSLPPPKPSPATTPAPTPAPIDGSEYTKFDPEAQLWVCHDYLEGQDTDWCEVAGTFGGFEYRFFGFLRAPLSCQSVDGYVCPCCKRKVEDISEDDLEEAMYRTSCAITRKEDCSKTRCCKDPGMQCYEKNKYWAACEADCVDGIDPRDHGIVRTAWTCNKLGPRQHGTPIVTTTTLPPPTTTMRALPPAPPAPAPEPEPAWGAAIPAGTAGVGARREAPTGPPPGEGHGLEHVLERVFATGGAATATQPPHPEPAPPAERPSWAVRAQAQQEATFGSMKRGKDEQFGLSYRPSAVLEKFDPTRLANLPSLSSAGLALVFVASLVAVASAAFAAHRRLSRRSRYGELPTNVDGGARERLRSFSDMDEA